MWVLHLKQAHPLDNQMFFSEYQQVFFLELLEHQLPSAPKHQ